MRMETGTAVANGGPRGPVAPDHLLGPVARSTGSADGRAFITEPVAGPRQVTIAPGWLRSRLPALRACVRLRRLRMPGDCDASDCLHA